MSNEYRHEILVSLSLNRKRITDLSKEFNLSTQEISRHISRLINSDLTRKDVEAYYNITEYGKMILTLLPEFEYTSKHSEYFSSHTSSILPREFIKRIGDLSNSALIDNVLDFLRLTENIIKDAEERVWILVDQFPLNYLDTILNSLRHGVKFKLIESTKRDFNAELQTLAAEESSALKHAMYTPMIQQKVLDHGGIGLYLSEKACSLAFPIKDGQTDYIGFISDDESSLQWCIDLYERYWEDTASRLEGQVDQIEFEDTRIADSYGGSIIVEGTDDPTVDAKIIQDAVDNYDEVILKGSFNIGTSTIYITRSITLRGEGRENDIPLTRLKKQGWKFPSTDYEYLMLIEEHDIEVTIENLHFTDWNNVCIGAGQGKSVYILNNRLTLNNILGRGIRFGNWGDQVIGILVAGEEEGCFPENVVVKGNFLDFGTYYMLGGFRPRLGLENSPDFRPNLLSHENCVSHGIIVKQILGKVRIENNMVRNLNAFCIWAMDCKESSEVLIKDNKIISGVYGKYAVNRPYAGYGILAHSHWEASIPNKGYSLEIIGNQIDFDKVNFCGIAVHGPIEGVKGSVKLNDGVIKDNDIHLEDGSVGILLYCCDGFEADNNRVSGKAYYGLQVIGAEKRRNIDLSSNMNLIENIDFSELEIKNPDAYSNERINNQTFAGHDNQSDTSHVWLNIFSKHNKVRIKVNEKIIDEGEDNKIEYI